MQDGESHSFLLEKDYRIKGIIENRHIHSDVMEGATAILRVTFFPLAVAKILVCYQHCSSYQI